jgi:hypothetical protein
MCGVCIKTRFDNPILLRLGWRVGFVNPWKCVLCHVPCFGLRGVVTTVMHTVSTVGTIFKIVWPFLFSLRSYGSYARVLDSWGLEVP